MKQIFNLNAIYYIEEEMYFLQFSLFTSFVEKLIFHHKALTHLSILISILSHPTQSWYHNSFVWKDFFSFSSVIIHVELKNGKENIKKNQKMHQGYTIATKTHAKIKKVESDWRFLYVDTTIFVGIKRKCILKRIRRFIKGIRFILIT